jgi:hypothetical protein
MGYFAHSKKSTGDYMDIEERLDLIRLADGLILESLVKNSKRLNSLYSNIDYLKASADKLVLERIKESDMTIEECSAHARNRFISFDVDVELLSIMAKKSTTFKDVMEVSRVFFHYRKDDRYFKLFVKEYSKPENKVNWREWFLYLTFNDSWYLRVSRSIEHFVLSKIFETAPEKTIIETIDFCFKENYYRFKSISFVLSNANLPIETWEIIRNNTTRKEYKEIWQIAEEKIKTLQV